MRYHSIVWVALMLCASFAEANPQSIFSFELKEDEVRFAELTKRLRCHVCDNQSLFDSRAPLAIDLKTRVYELMLDGQSDEEIQDYLLARYGAKITFSPPITQLTVWLWVLPVILLVMMLWFFVHSFRRTHAAS